ncbi:hypothetical protein IW140_005329 [Coemansia sp. RSA 1813]|nr:hypothetical protein EV178_005295 [Coemansia sp. RSA 1646]KAJ1765844.1 hypothetical protein LPJ74_006175 [Coemansia sp. RSA 1843]KAJ2087004.1 hypothetical protein IW138_005284 [Coemansia sp. RSA 986]KAJ2215577.1 hypothetical protein EV179_001987 [Coemansia sp. RSA 487]KAJ2565432.1 hypothetical protein IW140_005329 [Coemansia sp. RSA 1813]
MFRSTAARSIRPTVSRLAQTQTAARRFASSENNSHHDKNKEEEYVFDEENFSSPMWKYSLGVIGVLFLMGRYDDYIEKSGRVHPLTKFYASIMSDEAENRDRFREHSKEVAKQAEFNILQWEEKRNVESVLDDVVYYKRTAEWGTPVGTSVDMSAAEDRSPIRK